MDLAFAMRTTRAHILVAESVLALVLEATGREAGVSEGGLAYLSARRMRGSRKP
jgi:hypothetical protein